jgi:hypothetical protein
MTTLSPGALATCRQTGSRLWVVKEPLPDNRLRLIGVRTDRRGRADYSTRISGAGDVQVIRDAEVYAVGSTINYEGLDHLVLEDQGDSIEVSVPKQRRSEVVGSCIPSDNVRVSKAQLAIAAMLAGEGEADVMKDQNTTS